MRIDRAIREAARWAIAPRDEFEEFQRELTQKTKLYDSYRFPECAYIAQLMERHNTIKIGCTSNIRDRLKNLQHQLGKLRILALFPHDYSYLVEQALLGYFGNYLAGDYTYLTEVFSFTTKEGKQHFQFLMDSCPSYFVQLPLWEDELYTDLSERDKGYG